MKSTLQKTLPHLALALLATAATSALAAKDGWPVTNPQHHSHFCGLNTAQADQTAPAGYGKAYIAELNVRTAGGKITTKQAVEQLQSKANCSALFAKSGAGAVKTVAAGKGNLQ